MAKQAITRTETSVTSSRSNGRKVEQIYTVDDSFLPPPEELVAYRKIDPEIVKLLTEASRKEQEHRHFVEKQKIKIINRDSTSHHSINVIGMSLAFLIMVLGLCFSAYLLYLEKDIAGTIFAGSTITIAVFAFLNHAKKK